MNSSRRWLIVFAIVISVLVIATVSLVLVTKDDEIALLPEDTPQGVVQRYLLAIKDKDYQTAYGYLSFEQTGKLITYNEWIRWIYPSDLSETWKATLGETTQYDDEATVEIIIDRFYQGGPFGNSQYSEQINFQLIKVKDSWFITSPVYLYYWME